MCLGGRQTLTRHTSPSARRLKRAIPWGTLPSRTTLVLPIRPGMPMPSRVVERATREHGRIEDRRGPQRRAELIGPAPSNLRLSMPSDGDMPQSCAQNLRVALSDREASLEKAAASRDLSRSCAVGNRGGLDLRIEGRLFLRLMNDSSAKQTSMVGSHTVSHARRRTRTPGTMARNSTIRHRTTSGSAPLGDRGG